MSRLHGRGKSESFNPSRLTLARQRRGMSKTQLAERSGLDRRSITAFEGDEYSPSLNTILVFAGVLGFPVEFFFGDDLSVPTPDSASFRALSKMSAGQRDMTLAQGALALHLSDWIGTKFGLPDIQIPNFERGPGPEEVALELRYLWGWGELPISNMVHLLEAKGVRVFSLSIDSREVDAFSMWHADVPFVFLNTQKSAERSRFDAAHELGHLVLHRHSSPNGRQAEREADEFASAFLMPRKSVIARALRFPTIAKLIELKRYWKVSLIALVYRMHSLGLINDWNYRNLVADISRKGYRNKEPNPIPRESSQVFAKVTGHLGNEGISKSQWAQELNFPVEELDQLIFGPVLSSMTGGGRQANDSRHPNETLLKLVK